MIPQFPIMTGLNRKVTTNQFSCVLWRYKHHAWWGGIMSYDFRLPKEDIRIHHAQYIVRVTLKPESIT
jgi:hypothetical protein